MTGVWTMPAASWMDVGLIVGALVGVPCLLLAVLVLLDRKAAR